MSYPFDYYKICCVCLLLYKYIIQYFFIKINFIKNGASSQTRTDGLQITKLMLYQLSYGSIFHNFCQGQRHHVEVL